MGQMVSAVKADARINIEVGVKELHRLHQLLLFVSADKNEKDMEIFKDVLEKKDKDRLEHWMQLAVFLTHFISNIETKAKDTNQTTQIDLVEYSKNNLNQK